jgi:hypothetical protein
MDIDYRDDIICSYVTGWTRYYREHARGDWNLNKENIQKELLSNLNRGVLSNSSVSKIEKTILKSFKR